MYGRGISISRVGGGGSDASSPAPTSSAIPTSRANAASYHSSIVTTLVVFLVAYVAWALIETHSKVRSSLEPKNVEFNLRTIILVTFTVILGVNILRIAFGKLAAVGVPGAAQALAIVANA